MKRLPEPFKKKNYKPYITANNPVFDPLPFKLEVYTKQGSDETNIEIRIPVVKELHT